MEILFDVHNLTCTYPKINHKVLEVEKLQIPVGKITFIIGISGVGKSTILETLGLMNNTIDNTKSDDKTAFKFYNPVTQKEEPVGLINLVTNWSKNETKLAMHRKNHFSFIFQNTNLMANLSAFENVIVTQLLQNIEYEEALNNTKEILSKIDLKQITDEHKINEISGGQKQRLAFARAISTDFTVLFADEPTGNLDYSNAEELFKILRKEVVKNNKTAIIVSHDISFAVDYADKIVYIQKQEGTSKNDNNENFKYTYGLINTLYQYEKETDGWKNGKESFSSAKLKDSLKNKLMKDNGKGEGGSND